MASFSGQVAAGNDDARWTLGAYLSLTDIGAYLGNQGGGLCGIIARINNVTIPQGAVISAASFSVYCIGINSPPASLIGKCDASDNAVMPASFTAAGNAAKTTGTTGTVSWANSSGFNAFDITAEVQEVVNRPGWVSGNSIVVYLYDNGSGASKYMYVGTYNDLPSEGPKLDVTYTAGGGGGGGASGKRAKRLANLYY